MASGAVPIRPVDQRVETPSPGLPSNPLRAEPIESGAGAAISGLGSQLMGFWQAQQQHQNALDLADRMDQFQQQVGTAKVEALNSGQQAPDMVKNFQSDSTDLIQKFTADPNNKHIAPQLALAMRQHMADQMQSFPAEATQRVYHDLDFKFNQQTSAAAATIGQNYTIQGTADNPTFQLSADGMAAMKRQVAAIDQAYPPDARPTENQYYRNVLAQKSAMQTGMSVAQDHPSLVDSYIKQHAAVLTPEQQMSLTNRATAAIDLPMRQINANNQATRAQLLQKYDDQVQSGNLDTAQLEHDARFKLITSEDYEKYTGIPLAQPSDPGAVSAAQGAIASAQSPEELDDLRASIAGNQLIRGKDSVSLPIQIENAKRQMGTAGGKARIAAKETINSAFEASGLDSVIADKVNPGARLNARRAALAEFEASTLNETDPAKISAAANAAIRNHPAPGLRPASKGAPPAGASGRLPGESMDAYGKRMKAAMRIH